MSVCAYGNSASEMAATMVRREIGSVAGGDTAGSCGETVAGSGVIGDVLLDELAHLKGVLPVQPSPLMVAPDTQSSSLKSTRLNGQLISCFVVGGECRLCFPQIISFVLNGVRIDDINNLFLDLNIHISLATSQQLDILKIAGVMPMTADSCGLVTKSDAERLVAKLLPQSSGPLAVVASRTDAVSVFHDCFGGCSGTLLCSLASPEAIECSECKYMFSGEKFVAHTHSTREIQRVCHWGFDSANWRHYLLIGEDQENDLMAVQRLHNFKYSQIRTTSKRHADCKNDQQEVARKVAALTPGLMFTLCSQLMGNSTAGSSLSGVSLPLTASVPFSTSSLATLSPQLQSMLTLQMAVAGQLPSASKVALPTNSTVLPYIPTLPLGTSEPNKIVDTSQSKNARTSADENLKITGSPPKADNAQLEAFLRSEINEPSLSFVQALILEMQRAEALKRETLLVENERLRRENAILRDVLSSSSNRLVCVPPESSTLSSVKVTIC
ncbi:hypothetical protein AB6A40_004983 [Gnathostoma spinigerum]|uniref:c-SKI SMAD4-binding domain-containing protein n=1 Tax=Gnathostoma spinigerum TaxID=75299 RepID=A0ABD6ELS7_9BILA